MQRKGQAQVVTTILLILIVLAAVIIVWRVIDRFVEGGGGTITTKFSCVDVKLDIVSASDTDNSVTVTRLAGGDTYAVKDIKILVAGISATVNSVTTNNRTLAPLETKTYSVSEDIVEGDKIEIAAVLQDDTVCEVMDSEDAVA